MNSPLRKKVSLFYLVLFVLAGCVVSTFVTLKVTGKSYEKPTDGNVGNTSQCDFVVKRLQGDSLTKPILFVESSCESDKLQILKNEINNIVLNHKSDGTLTSSSVYLREFLTSDWICINGSETYYPGSLMKVPILITFLKMKESNPALLDRKLVNSQLNTNPRSTFFNSQSIKPNTTYSIRELLGYMIKYSDNLATQLLARNMDAGIFKHVFTDLGLTCPNEYSSIFPMTVSDYSKIMRALFNASYLNQKDSETAIELLTGSEFNKGIKKGIPGSVRVAHKFGEEGDEAGLELHESAIVYLNDSPYVLTIMTKGKDYNQQAKVLEEISAKVYQSIQAESM